MRRQDNNRDPTEPKVSLPKGYYRDPGKGPLKNQGDRLEKTDDAEAANSDSDTTAYARD